MFFRSRPTAPVVTQSLPPQPIDTHRPRSSSHAPPTAHSSSHTHSHNHPHPHINTSAIFPSTSPIMRRDSASTYGASPTTSRGGQPTPQLLHRSSTSSGPFSFTSTTSTSPSFSSSPATPSQQQHMLLNSSFSLSTSTASSASSSAAHHHHHHPSPSSTHYSYHHFSQKMKDPLATPLVKRLKHIVTSITSRPPPPSDQLASTARDIHTQLHSLAAHLPAHPLFARCGAGELANAVESMEKFVLSKLYGALYWPASPGSALLARSRAFYGKCRALAWLHGRHLELPVGKQDVGVWREAGLELRRMAEYKAPKDKLVCLLNACHIIHHTLLSKPAGSAAGEVEVGADDIFPAFIFALIHAHPRHFLLDLRWVTVGRYPEAMKGECEYWVTMAESAIVFIERMSEQSIRVEREGEWDSEMMKAKVRREEERRKRKEAATGSDRHSGGSSVGGGGGGGGDGGKPVEEEKRSVEEDDRSNADRSDSDRESDMAATGGNSARLSAGTNSNDSSLSADDCTTSDRRQLALLHTDDDLNSSTTSSTSSSSSHSPTHSPLHSTTPLPSPLLLPSHPPTHNSPPTESVGGGGMLGGLALSYVGVEACELRGEDVVRLLEEYKEMAAVIKMWSAKGSG